MIPRSAARATKSGSSLSSSATTGQPPPSISSSIRLERVLVVAVELDHRDVGFVLGDRGGHPVRRGGARDHLVTEAAQDRGDAVERRLVLVGDEHAQPAVELLVRAQSAAKVAARPRC